MHSLVGRVEYCVGGHAMVESFVFGQVRRASKNAILVNGLLLAAIALVLFCARTYYYHFFAGPARLADEQLIALSVAPQSQSLLAYADLGARVPIETHWKEVTTKDDVPAYESHYYFVPVRDKFLLVLAKSPDEAAWPVGPISQLREFDKDILEKVFRQQPQYRDRVLPFILNDVAAFMVGGYIGLALMVPIALLALANIARSLLGIMSPLSHPIVRRLSRYGEPTDVVSHLDSAIVAQDTEQVGRAILARFWLVRPTVFGMKVFQLADVVWVYHQDLSHESFVVVHTRDGRKSAISLKRGQADTVIGRIGERCPWVRIGYDKQWQLAWRTNSERFIAEVDQYGR